MQPACRDMRIHSLFTMRRKFFDAGFLRRLRTSPSLKRAILPDAKSRRDEMNSTEQLTYGSITADFPPLRLPKPEIADRGTVRLGSGMITAGFAPGY